MNRTLTFAMIPVLGVVLGGAIQVGRPLPSVQLGAQQSQLKLPGAFAVSFLGQGQVAVGEEDLGVAASTPNQEPVAIASLTKMMTAYLLLQAKPLKVGEDGPVTTLTADDVQVYDKDRAAGDSVIKVAAGEKLTERQLLEALMLPSADNIATLIAKQVGGSEENFIKKMNQTAQALGMTQTTYADAAGVNAATVSTANDQIKIAQAVMHDRIFREIVREPQAALPVSGVVYNVDFMVGKQGMSGIKTGSTLAAGSCFVGSFPVTINGKPRILLGAVLGQKSLHDALTYDVDLLHKSAAQFKQYDLPAPSEGIASLTTPWHQTSPLQLAHPIKVFGYPGMPIKLESKLSVASLPIEAGQQVASVTVAAGTASQTIPLRAVHGIHSPDLLWRLIR